MAQKIKEPKTTSIPLIPSHFKIESKPSKSRENSGKSETLGWSEPVVRLFRRMQDKVRNKLRKRQYENEK